MARDVERATEPSWIAIGRATRTEARTKASRLAFVEAPVLELPLRVQRLKVMRVASMRRVWRSLGPVPGTVLMLEASLSPRAQRVRLPRENRVKVERSLTLPRRRPSEECFEPAYGPVRGAARKIATRPRPVLRDDEVQPWSA